MYEKYSLFKNIFLEKNIENGFKLKEEGVVLTELIDDVNIFDVIRQILQYIED